MKFWHFIVRFFAVIGLLAIVGSLLTGYAVWRWLSQPIGPPEPPKSIVLELDLTKPVVEQGRAWTFSLESLLHEEKEISILDIVNALDRAKEDPRVKGVVARLGSNVPSLAYVQEIRDALKRFRDSGKFSYIFATSYGGFGQTDRAYYLASAFENIWVQPVGSVGLTGIGMDSPFAKSALEKIGIKGEFLRRKQYKSFMESVTRDEFSPPVLDNMKSMIKNLSNQIQDGIAESRKVNPDVVKGWMARGPFTASEALNEGLITRVGYVDEMLEVTRLLATGIDPVQDKKVLPSMVPPSDYLAFSHRTQEPKATVALIYASGLITDVSIGPSGLTGEHVIDADKLVQAFAMADADPDVQAVLFRVDSPGGSPEISETIRRALVKTQKAHKPVFVSMGDVAASGGYWIVMDAAHITAEPGTLTGSIGVVAGKFVIEGLTQKLGIEWDSLSTEDNAHMWSMLRSFKPDEIKRVNAFLDDTYNTFVANVAKARRIPLSIMDDVAGGRVWTGEQAKKVGLVDELGGLQTTVQAIKKDLKLKPDDTIMLKTLPPPVTPAIFALKILKNIGVDFALLHSGLGVLQHARQTFSPLLENLEYDGAINARLPSAFLEAVR